MAVKKTEKQLEDNVKKRIKLILLKYVKEDAISMFSNNGRGRSGIADFYVTLGGTPVWIEAKATASHKPRFDQCAWLRGKADAGDTCLVVNGDNICYLSNLISLIAKQPMHLLRGQEHFNGGFISLLDIFTSPWMSRLKEM